MKTTRTFKGSWFLLAIIATIALGEIAALKLSEIFGLRISPITVAFLGAGVVAVITSLIYEDADIG